MHMHYRKVDFIKQSSYRFDNRVHHERMWPLGVELLLGNEIANYKNYIKINIKTRSLKNYKYFRVQFKILKLQVILHP